MKLKFILKPLDIIVLLERKNFGEWLICVLEESSSCGRLSASTMPFLPTIEHEWHWMPYKLKKL